MSAGQGAVLSGWFLAFIIGTVETQVLQTREGAGGAGDTVALTLLSLRRPVSQSPGTLCTREMDQCAKVYGEGSTDPSEQLRGGGLCSCHSLCTLTRPWQPLSTRFRFSSNSTMTLLLV